MMQLGAVHRIGLAARSVQVEQVERLSWLCALVVVVRISSCREIGSTENWARVELLKLVALVEPYHF